MSEIPVQAAELAEHLQHFLPRQRWFGHKGAPIERVDVSAVEILKADWPMLIRIEASAAVEDADPETYQMLIGLRSVADRLDFLEENSGSVLGEVSTPEGPAHAYDGLRDSELALAAFKELFPHLDPPELVRPVLAEQSNTLLIYDERLVFKMFRSLAEEVNLDLEVTEALGNVGFAHVAAPVGVWRSGGKDLGMVQPYLAGAVDGWAMALTSLRDMFGNEGDPALAGGDFAAEAERLGATTAEMHAALAEAFGTELGSPKAWAAAMEANLKRIDHAGIDREAASRVFQRMAALPDAGASIRVHGDLHLGQVMRTDTGWYVLDFGGEPSRPVEERRVFTSPFKDVAGMLRSLNYAAWTAMAEQEVHKEEVAREWDERNRGAFVDGYLRTARRLGGLLPDDESTVNLLLKAFELDRGIYEVGYEISHRPQWVDIPLAAIANLY
ncbi:MAG: phosphotransferase [Actinomycetota bacterium]